MSVKNDGVSALRSPETEPRTDKMASLTSLFPFSFKDSVDAYDMARESAWDQERPPSFYKTPYLHMTSSPLGSSQAQLIIRISLWGPSNSLCIRHREIGFVLIGGKPSHPLQPLQWKPRHSLSHSGINSNLVKSFKAEIGPVKARVIGLKGGGEILLAVFLLGSSITFNVFTEQLV